MSAPPYEEIDPLIRGVVRVLNERLGVVTLASCAGHRRGEEAYVSFEGTPEQVSAVLKRMPFLGMRGGFIASRPFMKAIWCDVMPTEDGLVYGLRIAGDPEYARAEAIEEVEKALFGKESAG